MAKTEVPDRGWSWVIAFACCFSGLILAGIFRTSGVLFVAFISTFGVTREEASWPMVVCISVLNLSGPFCGILGQKIWSSIITVLFGGVFGVGYGFMNTVMPCILNAYFLDLRTLANGIANSGSCIGSIILPVIFEHFIFTYGLSGCFLLTGGIVLHIAIAGCLMRPPPWLQKNGEDGTIVECGGLPKNPELEMIAIDDSERNDSSTATPESLPCLTPDEYCESGDSTFSRTLHGSSQPIREETCLQESMRRTSKSYENPQPEESFINRKLHQICLKCRCLPSICNCEETSLSIVSSFVEVLTTPMFHITAITDVIFYFLYHMYVVIIVDYALDRGVLDTITKYILFAFSISDLVGRLCFTWITDRKMISRSRFVMMCMTLIGLTFFLFPLATGYWSLVAVSCLYGLLLGCTMVMFPILLVEFCGTELHTVSYGCMCFMNGFASFGRPLLIGYFRDHVGSYSKMFYVLGILSAFSSTLWLLEKPFERRSRGEPFFGSCKKSPIAK
ncbi:uncharacterized protein CEXT_250471 [Caerostris extrusa]|uniref:Monocarboxylate transporter n=1 Tax=Caerostris extrusa TaxID=172846 RepID=A0AAV4U9C0_CAEEX|nr:uncharacterized protein CEXT_250471 [Caerostris extrusa]